jgi:hypothetical protein
MLTLKEGKSKHKNSDNQDGEKNGLKRRLEDDAIEESLKHLEPPRADDEDRIGSSGTTATEPGELVVAMSHKCLCGRKEVGWIAHN